MHYTKNNSLQKKTCLNIKFEVLSCLYVIRPSEKLIFKISLISFITNFSNKHLVYISFNFIFVILITSCNKFVTLFCFYTNTRTLFMINI